MADSFYQHNAVIRPPQDFDTRRVDDGKMFDRIVIDSRDRDVSLFPNPNAYTVNLYDAITSVISARLLCADIPFSSYLVNPFFNTVPFTVTVAASADGSTPSSTTAYVATVSTGDYTPADLAFQLGLSLNAACYNPSNTTTPQITFNVSYSSNSDNFTFACNTQFALDFTVATNATNMRIMTGFPPTVSPSVQDPIDKAYTVSSVYRRNFEYNSYIVMKIEQFGSIKSVSNVLENSFAVLSRQYTSLNISDPAQITKYFNPIIARLTKLQVSFTDSFGNPYDFQNGDHRFEIIIESYKHKAGNRYFGTNQ